MVIEEGGRYVRGDGCGWIELFGLTDRHPETAESRKDDLKLLVFQVLIMESKIYIYCIVR